MATLSERIKDLYEKECAHLNISPSASGLKDYTRDIKTEAIECNMDVEEILDNIEYELKFEESISSLDENTQAEARENHLKVTRMEMLNDYSLLD